MPSQVKTEISFYTKRHTQKAQERPRPNIRHLPDPCRLEPKLGPPSVGASSRSTEGMRTRVLLIASYGTLTKDLASRMLG